MKDQSNWYGRHMAKKQADFKAVVAAVAPAFIADMSPSERWRETLEWLYPQRRTTIAKTLIEYLDDLLAPLYALHRDPTERELDFAEVFLRNPRERSRA